MFVVGFITSCKESETPLAPSKLDSLFKIQMTNGDVIYASPEVNGPVVEWGGYNTNITALTDIALLATARTDFSGEANTNAIVAQLGVNGGTAYAAKVCADMVAHGFDDWYLPAAGELDEMYKKLGAVAQGGSGQITTGSYWSSSERNSNEGYVLYVDKGLSSDFKELNSSCLCVRREQPSSLDSLFKVTMINGEVIYVHPWNTDDGSGIRWGDGEDVLGLENIATAGEASTDINGEANTAAIVAAHPGNSVSAAKLCADLVSFGFDDWYLPAAGELNEMYLKLGPNGTRQMVSGGPYWSSTKKMLFTAWAFDFQIGELTDRVTVGGMIDCRCVRK